MPLSPAQLRTLQIARRQVEGLRPDVFDEPWWRNVLVNVGKVARDTGGHASSKLLTNAGFDSVMAFLEESGFRDSRGEYYWRMRDSSRTGFATSRQVAEIHRLAARQNYELARLCLRVSNGTHTQPSKLTPAQARKLIEGLKDITSRQEVAS